MTRRLFGTLCGLVFLLNFGRVVFAPLIEPLQASFGVGPAAIGLVTSLVWFGTAVPRIPVGYVLTRVPRHRVVLGTGILLAVAAAVTASAPSIRVLQVGAFAVGVASGAYFAAAVPLVAELYPGAVGRAAGVHGMAAQLAAVLAPAVAAAALAVASWRGAFWVLSAAAVALTGALSLGARGDDVPAPDAANRDFLAALAQWRIILTGVLLVATAGFVWQGLFNFYVPYLTATKGVSPGTANALLAVVFAAGVPAFVVSGRLADRLPHIPYLLGLLWAFAGGLFALTVVRRPVALVAVTAFVGYAIHSVFPALDAYVLDVLPGDVRASAYAVFSGLSLLLESGGSGAVGALTGAGHAFDAVFRAFDAALCGVLVLLVVLYALGKLPTADGDERSAPSRVGNR